MSHKKSALNSSQKFCFVVLSIVLPGMQPTASAQHGGPQAAAISEAPHSAYSTYAAKHIPRDVYFGDTHLHTSYSTDAGMLGAIVDPEDAYRLARGETIVSSTGVKAKLSKPLDFLVVSDHAENLGLAPALAASDPELLASDWGRALAKVKAENPHKAFFMWATQLVSGEDKLAGVSMSKTYWQRSNQISERYYDPGLFTSLIGFEWTSMPGGNNLHRNVIFRDGRDKTSQILPMSSYDSNDPEDLWQWMANYEEKTGGKVLAIPHNGNLSNGLMFDDLTLSAKKPLDRDYAARRMRWEPLYEVTQIKGDAEAHPALSTNDEFADFYTWDSGSLNPDAVKEPAMLPREYAREALKRGLVYAQSFDANPFKFGMLGSTDSHTSIASTEEDNFFGKMASQEPGASPEARYNFSLVAGKHPDPSKAIHAWRSPAGGLAAVWATENTREALWDAMARKEVYATTGTRLRVRVFAGFDYQQADLKRSDFAEYAYKHGVPMGGDLRAASRGKAPGLLIHALKDADGANLDRIQIIKGWVDKTGARHEKIYDVAVSGQRKPDANGKYPPVGNTVDLKTATYTNAIGATSLAAFWQDPDFKRSQYAFYYVRVLEIPTPNWLAFDAKLLRASLPKEAPLIHQERAYTSPIWYTP